MCSTAGEEELVCAKAFKLRVRPAAIKSFVFTRSPCGKWLPHYFVSVLADSVPLK
jgi:hypothetical protein